MKRISIALSVLMANVLLSACQSRAGAAAQDLSRAFTCPIEDVSVAKVDISFKQRWLDSDESGNLLPEVKADPKRYALWKSQQETNFKKLRFKKYEVLTASGCGHTSELACRCDGIPSPIELSRNVACACRPLPLPRTD